MTNNYDIDHFLTSPISMLITRGTRIRLRFWANGAPTVSPECTTRTTHFHATGDYNSIARLSEELIYPVPE